MANITYQGETVALHRGETVLDGLLRQGIDIPYACKSGVCRACTMVAEGDLPAAAQQGLREVERRRGLFLSCQCRPEADLEVFGADDAASVAAEVVEADRLTSSVVRLRLRPEAPLPYDAGQYVALRREDGLTRSYSLASRPEQPWLELHIRRMPGGAMSRWAYEQAGPGTRVTLRGPYGSCCYSLGEQQAPLLLVGVGTGLAPLWGVLGDALASGHRGPIALVLAAAQPEGLYLRDEVRALVEAHDHLRLRTCVLRGGGHDGIETGSVDAIAEQELARSESPGDVLAFVCGDAPVVNQIRRGLFLAGASARRILADAFLMAPAPAVAKPSERPSV